MEINRAYALHERRDSYEHHSKDFTRLWLPTYSVLTNFLALADNLGMLLNLILALHHPLQFVVM